MIEDNSIYTQRSYYLMAPLDDLSSNVVYKVQVQSHNNEYAIIKHENNLTETVPVSELIQIDEQSEAGNPELLLLNSINEASLLTCIKSRYAKRQFYTSLGKITIRVNPGDLKSNENEVLWISTKILKKVRTGNQSLVFVGESQSGKSFAFSKVLKCLFSYNEKSAAVKAGLFLLKAFTCKGKNGKFGASRYLINAKVLTSEGIAESCMFECHCMDRFMVCDKSVQNFAVFYMIGEVDDSDIISFKKCFQNLNILKDFGRTNEKTIEKFKKSIEKLGFFKDFRKIIRVLYAILALGNLEFTSESEINNESLPFVQFISRFLEISQESLMKSLMTFTRTVGKSILTSKLDVFECEMRKKSLIRVVYSRLVNFIISQINNALSKGSKGNVINIVDYPGSQNSSENSLEELLINYVNEKFHQKCISTYFPSFPLNLTNNLPILDLLENETYGILTILGKSCSSKSSDLHSTIKSVHLHNDYFESKSSEFSVYHSFSKVSYCTSELRVKNIDFVHSALVVLLENSKNSIVNSSDLYSPNSKLHSLVIQEAVNKIIDSISRTKVRFIYCLNAKIDSDFNEKLLFRQVQYFSFIDFILQFKATLTTSFTVPDFFGKYRMVINSNLTTQKNIEILSERLGIRPDHFHLKNKKIQVTKPGEKILNKYLEGMLKKCVVSAVAIQRMWKSTKAKNKLKKYLRAILRIQAIFRGRKQYLIYNYLRYCALVIQKWFKNILKQKSEKNRKIGTTVFFKFLELKIRKTASQKTEKLALTSQRLWKGFKARKKLEKKAVCLKIRSFIFEKSWEIILRNIREFSAITIQKTFRGKLSRDTMPLPVKKFMNRLKMKKCAVKIQKNARCFILQQKLKKMKRAVKAIRKCWFSFKLRKTLKFRSDSVVLIQRQIRRYLLRIKQIKLKLSNFLINEYSLIENIRHIEQSYSITQQSLPNIKSSLRPTADLSESSGTLSRLKLFNSTFSPSSKDSNPFHLEKMTFSIKVLNTFLHGDTSVIYPDVWTSTLDSVSKDCAEKEDILMDIKLGSCHTLALTSRGRLFAWGWNDKSQCLGFSKSARYLKELRFQRVLQVECGDDHSLVLTEEGELLAFGDNTKGQLGCGNYMKTDKVVTVKLPDIKTISAKGQINAAINKKGQAFIWPYETQDGQKSSIPTGILNNIEIQELSIGFNFVVFVCTSGLVYSYGTNKDGQLGHGDLVYRKSAEVLKFFKNIGEKIGSVSAGLNHVTARSTLGKLFVWGGNNKGQLGVKSTLEKKPVLVPVKHGKIVQVSAGLYFSVVLTENRKIFGAGNGNSEFIEYDLTFLEYDPKEFAVVRVKCEWNRLFCLVVCTFCDIRAVQRSYIKVQTGMNQLAAKWGKSIEPPIVETLAPFYSVIGWRRSPLRNA